MRFQKIHNQFCLAFQQYIGTAKLLSLAFHWHLSLCESWHALLTDRTMTFQAYRSNVLTRILLSFGFLHKLLQDGCFPCFYHLAFDTAIQLVCFGFVNTCD